MYEEYSFQKIIEYYKKITEDDQSNGKAWAVLGHCYLLTHDLRRSFVSYQKSLYNLNNTKDPNLWFGIALLYDMFESPELAEPSFLAVLKIDPNFTYKSEIYYRLGLIFMNKGQYDHALSGFKNAKSCEAYSPQQRINILLNLAICYEKKKEFKKAIETFDEAREYDENSSLVEKYYGWFCLNNPISELGITLEKAREHLKKATQLNAEDAEAHYLLGRCFLKEKEYQKSHTCFQKAIDKHPNNATYWCTVGVMFIELQQYHDAFDTLMKAISLNNAMSEIWYNCGVMYECTNFRSQAQQCYQNAVNLKPANEDAKTRLKMLMEDQKLPQGAQIQTQHPEVACQPLKSASIVALGGNFTQNMYLEVVPPNTNNRLSATLSKVTFDAKNDPNATANEAAKLQQNISAAGVGGGQQMVNPNMMAGVTGAGGAGNALGAVGGGAGGSGLSAAGLGAGQGLTNPVAGLGGAGGGASGLSAAGLGAGQGLTNPVAGLGGAGGLGAVGGGGGVGGNPMSIGGASTLGTGGQPGGMGAMAGMVSNAGMGGNSAMAMSNAGAGLQSQGTTLSAAGTSAASSAGTGVSGGIGAVSGGLATPSVSQSVMAGSSSTLASGAAATSSMATGGAASTAAQNTTTSVQGVSAAGVNGGSVMGAAQGGQAQTSVSMAGTSTLQQGTIARNAQFSTGTAAANPGGYGTFGASGVMNNYQVSNDAMRAQAGTAVGGMNNPQYYGQAYGNQGLMRSQTVGNPMQGGQMGNPQLYGQAGLGAAGGVSHMGAAGSAGFGGFGGQGFAGQGMFQGMSQGAGSQFGTGYVGMAGANGMSMPGGAGGFQASSGIAGGGIPSGMMGVQTSSAMQGVTSASGQMAGAGMNYSGAMASGVQGQMNQGAGNPGAQNVQARGMNPGTGNFQHMNR